MALFFRINGTWHEFSSPEKGTGYIYPKYKTVELGYDLQSVSQYLKQPSPAFTDVSVEKSSGLVTKFRYKGNLYGINPKAPNALIVKWAGSNSSNNGTDFGKGGKYPGSVLGLKLAANGKEPVLDGWRWLLELKDTDIARSENEIRIKEKARYNDNIFSNGNKKAIEPVINRVTAEDIKRQEEERREAEAQFEQIRNTNLEVITKGIESGEIVFPEKDAETGKVKIPEIIHDVLAMRGIDSNSVPKETLLKVGFIWGKDRFQNTKGIKLIKNNGEEYANELKGLIFKLDEGGYQVRCMKGFKGGKLNPLHFVTKATEDQEGMRFITTGKASPCGLRDALEDAEKKPIIIVEGIIDKISIDNISNGRFDVVALQGAGNRQYVLQNAELLKKQNRLIVVALDGDSAGCACSEALINGDGDDRNHQKGFKDYGITTLKWPGCLTRQTADGKYINKDINELLQKDKESAKRLIAVIAYIAETTAKGLWTKDILENIDNNCFKGENPRPINYEGLNSQEQMGQAVMDMVKTFTDGRNVGGTEKTIREFAEIIKSQSFKEGRIENNATARENLEKLIDAEKSGDVVSAFWQIDESGYEQQYTYQNIIDALNEKGIQYNKLPSEIIDKIGFIQKNGIAFIDKRTRKVEDTPSFGLLFKADGYKKESYQLYRMTRNAEEQKLKYEYKNEEAGSIGKKFNTFGFDYALKEIKHSDRALVITDSVFDTLSIMVTGNKAVSTATISDITNEQIRILKERNIPVILVLGENKTEKNNRIMREFLNNKCEFTVFPGTLGYKNINEILQSDIKTSSNEHGHKVEKLLEIATGLIGLAREGKYTPQLTADILKGISRGRINAEIGSDGTQMGYALLISLKIKEESELILNQFKGKTDKEKDGVREAFLTICLDSIKDCAGGKALSVDRDNTTKVQNKSIGTQEK